jgi:hypothetical protein
VSTLNLEVENLGDRPGRAIVELSPQLTVIKVLNEKAAEKAAI